MQSIQKWLLALGVAGLALGIAVTAIPSGLAPLWTLALPLGAVFLGLFLLTHLWHKELAKFDEEEHLRIESARRHRFPNSEGGRHSAADSPSEGLVDPRTGATSKA